MTASELPEHSGFEEGPKASRMGIHDGEPGTGLFSETEVSDH